MGLPEMRQLLPCAIHEVFRIETCAERLLARALPWDAFLAAFRQELREAAGRCVALKSIVAYRSGLAIRSWTAGETAAAYRDAVASWQAGGSTRLTAKPLLDTLFLIALTIARETRRPLQVHAGFGDPDLDLLHANPLLLRPILEDPAWADVRLVVLHAAYPYFREAAFMTAVWPQVYLDLSLALPYLGAGAVPSLVEILSLGPASKLLYGSDLQGIPELFALAADWARAALGEALGWLAERERRPEESWRAVARQILSANATTLYGLRPAG
jgi:predicted TIM-barrel fold metal-dependent hydrolase